MEFARLASFDQRVSSRLLHIIFHDQHFGGHRSHRCNRASCGRTLAVVRDAAQIGAFTGAQRRSRMPLDNRGPPQPAEILCGAPAARFVRKQRCRSLTPHNNSLTTINGSNLLALMAQLPTDNEAHLTILIFLILGERLGGWSTGNR